MTINVPFLRAKINQNLHKKNLAEIFEIEILCIVNISITLVV